MTRIRGTTSGPWSVAVTAVAAVCAASLCTPSPVEGQAPGGLQIPRGQVQAEYAAEVLLRINDVLAEWGDAWAGDRLDELVDAYWEDALLVTIDGQMKRGHAELRSYFTEALPAHGRVEAFTLDFDASGGMSQVVGNYQLDVGGAPTQGVLITVYMQRGRRWKIRSQVFMPPG